MAKVPYFPLNAQEYLLDEKIEELTLKEQGALINLWCWMWINKIKRGHLFFEEKTIDKTIDKISKNDQQNAKKLKSESKTTCKIPINDQKIAGKLQTSVKKWEKIRGRLLETGILKIGKDKELYSERLSNYKTKYELYDKDKVRDEGDRKTNDSVTESEADSNRIELNRIESNRIELNLSESENVPKAENPENPFPSLQKQIQKQTLSEGENQKQTISLPQIKKDLKEKLGHEPIYREILQEIKERREGKHKTIKEPEQTYESTPYYCRRCHNAMADEGSSWFCSDCQIRTPKRKLIKKP